MGILFDNVEIKKGNPFSMKRHFNADLKKAICSILNIYSEIMQLYTFHGLLEDKCFRLLNWVLSESNEVTCTKLNTSYLQLSFYEMSHFWLDYWIQVRLYIAVYFSVLRCWTVLTMENNLMCLLSFHISSTSFSVEG